MQSLLFRPQKPHHLSLPIINHCCVSNYLKSTFDTTKISVYNSDNWYSATMASNPDEVTLYLSREMLAFNSENTSFVSDRSVKNFQDGTTVQEKKCVFQNHNSDYRFLDGDEMDEDEEDQLFSLRPIR